MPTVEPGVGDIGCVAIKGDVGWLIALGEKLCGDRFSQYQHAFVVVAPGRIVEAEPNGAREADLSEYDGRTIAWVECPDEHRDTVAAAAKALISTPYSPADYFAIAAHRFHIPGFKRIALGTSAMICSQLATVAARRGGWPILGTEPAGYVTPADLAVLAEPAA